MGERFVEAFAHGTMSVELYFPISGEGTLRIDDTPHRFESFSGDFAT